MVTKHTDKVRAEFHALSYTLGPFGRQDIHLHPRIDRESKVDVLVGFDRVCDPKRTHAQMRQTLGSSWWQSAGKSPKPATVARIGGTHRSPADTPEVTASGSHAAPEDGAHSAD